MVPGGGTPGGGVVRVRSDHRRSSLADVPDAHLLHLEDEADPRPVLYGDGSVGPDRWHSAWTDWRGRRQRLYAEHGRDVVQAEARRRCEAGGDHWHDVHRWFCPRCVTTSRDAR